MLLKFFLFSFLSKTLAGLPECPWIDPQKETEKWHNFDYSSCEVNQFSAPSDPKEAERYDFGQKNFMFNALVSDKLGPRREIPNVSHEKWGFFMYGGPGVDFESPKATLVEPKTTLEDPSLQPS